MNSYEIDRSPSQIGTYLPTKREKVTQNASLRSFYLLKMAVSPTISRKLIQ